MTNERMSQRLILHCERALGVDNNGSMCTDSYDAKTVTSVQAVLVALTTDRA